MPRRQTGFRGSRSGFGRMGKNKVAWLSTLTTRQLVIHQIDPSENDEELGISLPSEAGNAVVLMIPVPGRSRPLAWDFTGMTGEELDATRQFFEYLFDLADPVVRERDRVAADAYTKGDDSFSRVYRQVPQFIVRERQKPSDSESVHLGSEDTLDRDGSTGDNSGRLSDGRDELAYGEQGESSSQDDRATSDLT